MTARNIKKSARSQIVGANIGIVHRGQREFMFLSDSAVEFHDSKGDVGKYTDSQ